jgi:hypothetical protein
MILTWTPRYGTRTVIRLAEREDSGGIKAAADTKEP